MHITRHNKARREASKACLLIRLTGNESCEVLLDLLLEASVAEGAGGTATPGLRHRQYSDTFPNCFRILFLSSAGKSSSGSPSPGCGDHRAVQGNEAGVRRRNRRKESHMHVSLSLSHTRGEEGLHIILAYLGSWLNTVHSTFVQAQVVALGRVVVQRRGWLRGRLVGL